MIEIDQILKMKLIDLTDIDLFQVITEFVVDDERIDLHNNFDCVDIIEDEKSGQALQKCVCLSSTSKALHFV
jgi:hypothetical protein